MSVRYLIIFSMILFAIGCTEPQSDVEQMMAMEAHKVSQQNLAIVKSTYEGKTSTENGQNLQRYVAQEIEWTEAAGFPLAGTYVGFPAIAEHVFKPLSKDWQDYRFVVEDYVADGDKVVAYGTYSGKYRTTNKSFEARVTHVWQLRDRKIIRFEQFVDSVPVVVAMK